jgi:hypothetical protein
MPARSLRSLGVVSLLGLLAGSLSGCGQVQPFVERLRSGQLFQGGNTVPYIYSGSSNKAGGQDVTACIANVRSILSSNGYVNSVEESTSDDGSAAWISGDRNDIGVVASFQCAANGVTVLAMSGLDNDKLFPEYDRIHDLNW